MKINMDKFIIIYLSCVNLKYLLKQQENVAPQLQNYKYCLIGIEL